MKYLRELLKTNLKRHCEGDRPKQSIDIKHFGLLHSVRNDGNTGFLEVLLTVLFALLVSFQVRGQNLSGETGKITPFLEALEQFSENIPQEKVSLHFDNTSYYHGDNIWFKCYVVTSGRHELSPLSKTLYVELLNPGGQIIDKRILRIENGQCYGDFTLAFLPFYSGFYEVRAYTKYMLNFGEEVIFSRLLPVFDKPKEEGNFEEKEMLKYGKKGPEGKYLMNRKSPEKGKVVNLRFFPEGGNLIQGVATRVAFEATDEAGNPIDVTGVVMDASKQELCSFTTLHEGKGKFTYTPNNSRRKDIAEVEYSGKKYSFDLPSCLPQGITMETDNLTNPDSIGIILRRNSDTPAGIFGIAVLSEGKLQEAFYAYTKYEETILKAGKAGLPSGVSQIVLFNGKGEVLCDRLVFIQNDDDFLDIKAKTNKSSYQPFELVEMEFSVTDRKSNPVNTAFSLSVRDASNEVAGNHTVLTDLLLMSEIRGYVRNPSWYFESDDETHRSALDLLLMVQGWRRYSWKQMAGLETFELKYLAEQGIETTGRIVSFVRQIPKPDVDVTLMLHQRGKEDEEDDYSFVDSFVTDSLGHFSFVADVSGKWSMTLSATEKGKLKDHRILLDRLFSPEPRKYGYAELQVDLAEEDNEDNLPDEEDLLEDSLNSFLAAYTDSLSKASIPEKINQLPEVTITAKRNSREDDIRNARQTSSVYYDVASELDDLYDSGKYIGDDIFEMLINMDKDFRYVSYTTNPPPSQGSNNPIYEQKTYTLLSYKNMYRCIKGNCYPLLPLFIIDYDRANMKQIQTLKANAIKAIYINETKISLFQWGGINADERYACIVFIETFSDGRAPAESAKGVRKTWLDGYSELKEFYSPDYLSLPAVIDDYRRTLYWNPEVTTDETGNSKISFYNNSRCTNFSISAEAVTSQGLMGVYRSK